MSTRDWQGVRHDWGCECEKLTAELNAVREALQQCENFQPEALKMFRKHKFVFAGNGGRWEKLALTLYTRLCEIYSIAKDALQEEKRK